WDDLGRMRLETQFAARAHPERERDGGFRVHSDGLTRASDITVRPPLNAARCRPPVSWKFEGCVLVRSFRTEARCTEDSLEVPCIVSCSALSSPPCSPLTL